MVLYSWLWENKIFPNKRKKKFGALIMTLENIWNNRTNSRTTLFFCFLCLNIGLKFHEAEAKMCLVPKIKILTSYRYASVFICSAIGAPTPTGHLCPTLIGLGPYVCTGSLPVVMWLRLCTKMFCSNFELQKAVLFFKKKKKRNRKILSWF